ncbi:MAG TPA: ATP-dependent DNA ligase [Candidatus Dormibacteraeota bacterium]|nr:ATP-dependent DNA ligase [Candidatus Dormibacteraeota bacterium]
MLDFARTAEAIAATSSTLEKARLLADYLRSLPPDDLRRAAIYMSGQPYGRAERRTLNLGWATIGRVVEHLSQRDPEELSALFLKHSDLGDWAFEALAARPYSGAGLSLAEVAAALDEIRVARTAAAKQDVLGRLLGRLNPLAAKYVVKVLGFELRIGLQEGLVEAAIAQAFDVPLEAVRRVHMLTGDVGETAVRCHAGELSDTRITLFQPLRFMLATPVEVPEEAFERMSASTVWTEEKYDGVRCQLHQAEGRCELFSRELKETAAAFPEIVEAGLALEHSLILDGEVLAHRGDRVLPFSDLQRRLGRKQVSAAMRREVPLVFVAFDLLYLDGEVIMDQALAERRRRMEGLDLSWPFLLARLETASEPADLDRIFKETRERGNEGLMVKDPASSYAPGRRGMAWLKLKRPLATLDVVVTAVEWGHGKRRGVLSDYTFAVRDEGTGKLLNVGKAYSGLTDAEIAEMTEFFLANTVADYGRSRLVEPNTVIEVAFDAIQRSARHRSGFALRFPRIVRLRPDKPVTEIDTLARVQELYERFFGRTVALAEVAEVDGRR